MPLGPPAATTKYQPPTPISNWVNRSRLTSELAQGADKRLVLLHGPAGYGKSTLAAQWLATLSGQGVRVAWFSLDQDDNNTIWFISHLLESLLKSGLEIDPKLLQLLQERPTDAEKYVVPSIINALAESDRSTVIALDDWHRITEPRTRAVLARLLDDGPESLRLVITSRTSHGLPLTRLAVRNQLLEIDSSSLRFDRQESRQWLVGINQLDLSEDDLSALVASTDGWAAALQLTWLSLKGQRDVSQIVRNISGRHQAIGDYLTENVLDTLEPDVLDFLLCTSITERTCAGLASHLSGVSRGQAMLEAVQSRDLFLQPLDQDGNWYRYHHLFEDYLRKRLERDDPERARQLHREAAQWYMEHGHSREAVDHALHAADVDFAMDVVEASAMLMVEHSQMSSLLALLRKVPLASRIVRPRLQMDVAWATCLLHYPEQSRTALERVEGLLNGPNDLEPTEQEELRIEALVVRRCLEMYADIIGDAEDLRSEVLNATRPLRPWIVSVAANIVTYGELHAGRFADAMATQRQAQIAHDQTTGPFSRVYGKCFAGMAAFACLDIDTAELQWTQALELGRRSAGHDSHAAKLAGGLLGHLRWLRGDVSAAEELLESARELGAHGGVVDFMLTVYSSLSRIHASRGDIERATEVIEAGEKIADELNLIRLQARLTEDRANLGLPWVRTHISQHRHPHLDRAIQAANASAELSSLLLAQSPSAQSQAEEVLDGAQEESNNYGVLLASIALAEALHAAGKQTRAREELKVVLEDCYRLNFPNLLMERNANSHEILWGLLAELEGGQWVPLQVTNMTQFLRHVLQQDTAGAVLQDSHIEQRTKAPEPSAKPTLAVRRIPKVSSREHEILQLLSEGMSNREIAQRLYIGINTVKWHLKNLFSTFGVATRQECVEAARRSIGSFPG